MKAADGMQIAERPEAAIRSAARFALELAGKSKHCEAVADCAHCNLTFLATWAENMLTDLSRAEERERVLREALKGILDLFTEEPLMHLRPNDPGYRMTNGDSDRVDDAFIAADAALTAAPEQGKEAKS